jgi:Fe2+ transport system protein FeoA
MFSMVYWEARYTAGVMLVAWGTVMASTNASGEERRARAFGAASLLLSAVVVFQFSRVLIGDYRESEHSAQTVMVAERLLAMGIEPGDHIALIGYGNTAAPWARLGRLRIVAEVPQVLGADDSATAFWNSSPQVEKAVLNVLKNTSAKVVIADALPATLPPGWVLVGNTGRAVYFLPEQP